MPFQLCKLKFNLANGLKDKNKKRFGSKIMNWSCPQEKSSLIFNKNANAIHTWLLFQVVFNEPNVSYNSFSALAINHGKLSCFIIALVNGSVNWATPLRIRLATAPLHTVSWPSRQRTIGLFSLLIFFSLPQSSRSKPGDEEKDSKDSQSTWIPGMAFA
ncbi:Uncharacterized protein TCM_002875 [Theobroma cacao]|uniref:Uncharacterized protein n=1 Tax=Theobroma cacao TaxID=3641 RepID=A0A061DM38_THECC|nr:Uncharacterized protein TCM_002875 [Theobroma cacao]